MSSISSQAYSHLQHLTLGIGHRPTGGKENEAAADYIERIFRTANLAVERQVFNCAGWEHFDTLIEVDGISYEGTANWRSLPCDVTGKIVAFGSIEMLEKADLTGSIALLHGEITQDELSPRTATAYYPDHHRRINQLLDQKQPLAIITVNPLLQSMRQVIKDPIAEVPSASVMPKVGMELLNQSGKNLHMKIASNRTETQAWNVIGSRSGTRPERIVISAHFDTVWGTSGAYDNASGASILISLAQRVAGLNLPVGVEFYAANGEEFGGQGTIAYLKKYSLEEIPFRWDQPVGENSQVWQPILANINIDGVGLALGANNITAIAASQAMTEWVDQIRRQNYPQVVQVDPWPASDHYTFYSHGVPSIAFSNSGGIANHHHQPVDTIEWISPEKMAEVEEFVLELVIGLSGKTPDWCRPTPA